MAGLGCERLRAQAPAKPVPPPTSVAPAAAVPAGPGSVPTLAGWRDLKFGMSEQQVEQLILGYRQRSGSTWQRAKVPHLPTVRLDLNAVDLTAVDPQRFHEWSIADLDDGAALVQAWHEDGKLVALEVTGKVAPDVFLRKATDAYGAQPKHVILRVGDDATGAWQTRDGSVWRSGEASALIWTSTALKPTLLVWSDGAMTRRAAVYQGTLDAPALAAKATAEADENGTKF
jgi:hypothetical protein